MIMGESRACRAIMPAGACLGRVSGLAERCGGEPPEFDPSHPLGCHRRRVPDRVVFEHVVSSLVHGSGYDEIMRQPSQAVRNDDVLTAEEMVEVGHTVHPESTRRQRSHPRPSSRLQPNRSAGATPTADGRARYGADRGSRSPNHPHVRRAGRRALSRRQWPAEQPGRATARLAARTRRKGEL